MSDDKKTKSDAAPARKWIQAPDETIGPAIPVALLKFDSNDCLTVDVPGLGGSSGLVGVPMSTVFDPAGKRTHHARCHVIDFFPAIRHHRIIYLQADGERTTDGKPVPPAVLMIPERHIKSWRPA